MLKRDGIYYFYPPVNLKINVYGYSGTLSSNFFLNLPPLLVNQGSRGLSFGVHRNGGAVRVRDVNVLGNSANARAKIHKEERSKHFPGTDVAEVTFRRESFIWMSILLR